LASQRFTLVDLRDGAPDGHDVVYGVELFQFTDGVLTATELRGSQTLTVGAGDGYQFASIQAAIDAALAGDTIEIAAGTYAEALTLNGKALSLTAADGAVVIDPPGTGLTALTLEGAFGADAV